jgi:hypothetical protein
MALASEEPWLQLLESSLQCRVHVLNRLERLVEGATTQAKCKTLRKYLHICRIEAVES